MIFHDKRTISIGRFAEMVTLKDDNLVKRLSIWVPQKLLVKHRQLLVADFNRLINEDHLKRILSKDLHKLKMLNRINVQYPSLLKLIDITAKYKLLQIGTKEEEQELEDLLKSTYKLIYNKEPKNSRDYEKVEKDHDLLKKKYSQLYPVDNSEAKELDVEALIVGLEIILAPVTIRDKKLYALPKYMDLASRKTKENGGN